MFLTIMQSLIDGYYKSNGIGRFIVHAQLMLFVVMAVVAVRKWMQILQARRVNEKFINDFNATDEAMEYYFNNRPSAEDGMEGIYRKTCERLLKLINPDVRGYLATRAAEDGQAAPPVLTPSEMELVNGTCVYALETERIRLESWMSAVATVVSLSPMLGLLGTVWGVLDAFAEMGTAGTANLATIAPSISSALVTTVIGLLVAIPGVIVYSYENSVIGRILARAEAFAEELSGRIACEYKGRAA